ncbi:MAG TPA: VIT1/CCC1 transporter family protein [Polyangia bacterium]|jgi:VIT1/CCC1 family predicted Fe2+/Mn2+ transporter|nr:VIT1/CCC1 transporter family protein [Polyangia bacterium]
MSVLKSWTQEMESAHLYRELSRAEPLPERRALFESLAKEAESQAAIWSAAAARASEPLPARFAPSVRTRIVAALARRLGAARILNVLAAMKVRGLSVYGSTAKGHPLPASADDIGKRHRGAAGGNLRAAVFGINDGLVSNASLILGVAGATGMAGHAVVISGVAGLLAGAFSMAAGEFVSVSSQREMLDRQVEAEREELAQYPDAEAAELSLIYQARGLPRDDADRMAERIVANPAYALDALVREELGVDPASLGSPRGAAGSSFVSFATGAFVPLVPFLVTHSSSALPASLVVTAAALFGVGATMSLFSGRSALHGGLRMLLIGAAAAGCTFLIGRLLGVAVS